MVKAKKLEYGERLVKMLGEYNRILVVGCDNVGSAQMQQIRRGLRGTAEVLMGKNTMIRKIMRGFVEAQESHPIEVLIERMRGNVGLVFTNGNLKEVRDLILDNKVPAPARPGAVAPSDVIVPAGPTGCDPGQTGWFQALNIATKIVRGQVEIISPVHLIREGEKVNPGQAALLDKLDIRPFSYGMTVQLVYDSGSLFSAAVLDLTEDMLAHKFLCATRNIAAVSMMTGLPTMASVPHSLTHAAKVLAAICTSDDVDYSFEFAEPFLAYLADPSAFASAAAPAAGGAAAAAVEEEEEEEEEAAGNVGGLFGDEEEGDGY
mmetsp:Transcript_20416/g.65312  ORF Transcript_20416/g.65312 Transcript_20416/m.65312 type:complete len:319 (+) Transcript_20416:92-1048(+)|eukprot:CAMPEP_0196772884 /NCGR_PEP_ID=MMETSP1104-20130614/2468_1 /TAXON_ID=33652 /ORGANISM="Cafeteria sp., Strain Caron Lab Isolate" /LENGTH=318 /DNA_ID=CAMNT_0042143027 /DNA_START=106 /DNA_END=1062 /DNA_ORIENTATION=+